MDNNLNVTQTNESTMNNALVPYTGDNQKKVKEQ